MIVTPLHWLSLHLHTKCSVCATFPNHIAPPQCVTEFAGIISLISICWWGCRHFPIGLSSAVPDSGIFDLRCDWPPQWGYRRGHAGMHPTCEPYKTTYIWTYRTIYYILCVFNQSVYATILNFIIAVSYIKY